jgi:hypothetical protein
VILAYLDQNILGYIQEGKFQLPLSEDVAWLYSTEHFTEISRGGDASFLSILRDLRAREIEVLTDEQWRIKDQAIVHDYACPFERHQQHLENIGDVVFDQTLFTDLFARFAGANNYEDVRALPERLQGQLGKLLGAGDHGRTLVPPELETAIADLVDHLREARSLEALRKPLGIHKGRVGNLDPDNALLEIWERVKDKCGDLTMDQFFGFDSPLKQQGEEERSTYQGIIACHTILNFMGYRTDKGLSDSAATPKILSDGIHIAHAAFCDLLISGDRRLTDKASAIYKYVGTGTQVVRLD